MVEGTGKMEKFDVTNPPPMDLFEAPEPRSHGGKGSGGGAASTTATAEEVKPSAAAGGESVAAPPSADSGATATAP
jgi:hypothetical protein